MSSNLTIITTTCDQFVTDQQCEIERPLIDKGLIYCQDNGLMDFLGDYSGGDEQVGFINTNGDDLFFTEDCLLPFHGDFAQLGTSKHWRLIDRAFKTVLDCDGYDRIYNYQCGFIRVRTGVARNDYSGDKYGYLDLSGREAIECQYDDAEDFIGRYAVVAKKKEDKLFYGVINSEGNVILDFKYDKIEIWKEASVLYAMIGTYYRTMQKEKHLLFNDKGDLLFESSEQYLEYKGYNFFICNLQNRHPKLYKIENIANRPYKVIREVDYISKHRNLQYCVLITEFKNGFARVRNFKPPLSDYEDAFLTPNGDLVPLCGIIRGLRKFQNKLYVLVGGGYGERALDGWGLYDTQGNKKYAFKNKYKYLGRSYFPYEVVSEDLLPFQNEHTGGYIDLAENIIIDDKGKYLYRGEFHNGIAYVGIDSGKRDDLNRPILLYGFINRNAEMILPFIYERVYYCDKSNAFLGVIHYEHNAFKGGKHHVIFNPNNQLFIKSEADIINPQVIFTKNQSAKCTYSAKFLPLVTEKLREFKDNYQGFANWIVASFENADEVLNKFGKEFGKMDVLPSTYAKYLFFDTETTGVPLNYKAPISDLNNWPRLVQLAWILCDEKGDVLLTDNQIVKPNGFIIPTEASNVHGITTKNAEEEGVPLDCALQHFIFAAQLADVVVCHNTEFDIKIVGAELLRIGSDFRIDSKPSICTMLKSMNYCAIPSGRDWGDPYKWPSLQELHNTLFGCAFEDAHDAMADIQATKKCFYELVKRNVIKLNKNES